MVTYPGDGLAYSGEFPGVVATSGGAVVGRVRDVTDHSVILLVEGDGGGPFLGKESPPSQVGEAALVVRFAVGPIRKKADDPCVGSKEKVLDVASTLGDPLCFRLVGVRFVEEPLKTPIGEVTELQVGQIVVGIQTRGVPAIDDVPFGAFGDVVRPGSHRGVKDMRALRPDSGTKLVELAYQPEEQRIRLPDCGVGKMLVDRVETEAMRKSQVAQCYSVAVCLLVQLEVGSSKESFVPSEGGVLLEDPLQ